MSNVICMDAGHVITIVLIATLIEFVYGLVHRWLDFQPLLCRAEVSYTTVYICYSNNNRIEVKLIRIQFL